MLSIQGGFILLTTQIREKISPLFVLTLCLYLPLLGNSPQALPQVEKPSFMTMGAGRLYISEETPKLHIYKQSANGFEFDKSFGREGQGPGEFTSLDGFRVLTDHLEIPSDDKLARFSHDGRFLDEIRLTIPVFGNGISRLGDKYAVVNVDFLAGGGNKRTIRLYGSDFKLLCELGSQENKNGQRRINLVADYLAFRVHGPHIYTIKSNAQESIITVFNQAGESINSIKLPIEGEKITPDLQESIIKRIKEDPEMRDGWAEFARRLHFPDYTPGLDYFLIQGDKIICRSYRTQGDRVEFIVFDMTGKELKRIFLYNTGRLAQRVLFCFHENNYWYLKENPDQEVWELYGERVM